jgi:hypothetical protein
VILGREDIKITQIYTHVALRSATGVLRNSPGSVPRKRKNIPAGTAFCGRQEETGKAPILDPDFAADVDEIVKNRKAWNPPAWE